MTLRPIASKCGAGDCPTVYVTDRNTVVVQGYAVSPQDVGVVLPSGEFLVEISPALLTSAAHSLAQP